MSLFIPLVYLLQMKKSNIKPEKKAMTINDIAVVMTDGFKGVNKRLDGVDKRLDGLDKRLDGVDKRFDGVDKKIDKLDKKIDSEVEGLASMVARGFEMVNKEMVVVKNDIAEVKENLAATRMDVLGIGDHFVSKHDFNQHLIRFSLLEEKVRAKK